MPKTRYLVVIAVVAFGTAALLPRLVDGDQPSFLTALLGDVSAKQGDRLEVGNPPAR